MTWKDFKEAVEAAGVTDETEYIWIDVNGADREICVGFEEWGEFYVSN